MKKIMLLSAFFATFTQAEVKIAENTDGKILEDKAFVIVRKSMKKDEIMNKHDHPKNDVIITVVSGKLEFTFNDKDVKVVEAGQVLHAEGKDFVSSKALEDSQFVVVLVHEHHEHAHEHQHEHKHEEGKK